MPGTRLVAATVLAFALVGLSWGERALERLGGGGPESGAQARGGVCEYRLKTGAPCMGCGGTRAFGQMARGGWREALALNPLGAFAALAAWLVAASALASASTARFGFLGAALGTVLALVPAAVVWNAIHWWLSLPPGPLSLPL